ncbi:protein of unknown function [Geodermatophilus pulveris]|uniref:DUF4397 domain-containing protein n=1 Tax=Geodermatophilus pulveris TaxID=1564159 RepID=A0A239DT07_9ACTN|nr:DUF4397 domain-containing protein [Geodermatophilus pulveris]SNS35339.1 protein of unknown function [Geodermatophilus pulveris]
MPTPVRPVRALAAGLLVAASAALAPPAAAATEEGLFRLAHLSPDTPAGDVYVDSVADPDVRLTFPGVGYGTLSDYREVPAGAYTVSMLPVGAPPGAPPILSATVDVAPGSARTVAGLGPAADLGLEVLEDDLTLPPADRARVRVVAAAAGAGSLDVATDDGAVVASDLAFASATEHVEVPGGPATLTVTPDGGPAAQLPVDLAAGSVYTLLVLDDGAGGLTVRRALDAAGSTTVPVGGVETGAGGLAGGPAGAAVLGAGVVLVAAAVVGVRARPGRRPARHRAR